VHTILNVIAERSKMMKKILLSIAIITVVVFTCYAAQETGTNPAQPIRRETGTRRGATPARAGTQYVETDGVRWLVHDEARPAPPIITPGTESTSDKAGKAPSDAIVLFDGNDMSNWVPERGDQMRCILKDGHMEPTARAGGLKTKQSFGSCQLHLEFATPTPARGTSQGRGNSGVFIMSTYEVQILDSYDNKTYPDGQCGALYGRNVPLVNVCRKPGEWQSYDIIFHRPIFNGNEVTKKATFTIFQNGVLIQDHVELSGGTGWIDAHTVTNYEPHADKLPLMLQDHENPVLFRNIWIRELKD
jgi:hypothetical protein